MRTMTLLALMFISPGGSAWGPGWGSGCYPGCWPGLYGGMSLGGGAYAMSGIAMLQPPSFNYTTTIVQSPPIVIYQNGEMSSTETLDYPNAAPRSDRNDSHHR